MKRPHDGGVPRYLARLLIAVVVFVAIGGLLLQDAAAILESGIGRVAGQLLGIGGERRYLVLAQNPAELRPAGGYAGTVGIIAFDSLRPVERSFVDVYEYDLRPGLPYVQPPDALANYLLGTQSWQLADAAWSPDFPTAAANALRLYALESGDADIDGVLALNTFAVDRLLEVTGPIDVPEYGVTVAAGEVTMTALRLTRGVSDPAPGADRKAFLDALAGRLMARLAFMLPSDWPRLAHALSELAQRRDVLVWFVDSAAELPVSKVPLGGAVRRDPGDYLYVVEANVEPSSKYNLAIDRSDTLAIALDAAGGAATTLHLEWQNHALEPGEPFESLRNYSRNKSGQYGAWVRVLTPASSVVTAAHAVGLDPISGIEETVVEAGRQSLGNYMLMGPGTSTLDYSWATPSAATRAADGTWTYRLTIQKQPGLRPPPLAVTVTLPAGARVASVVGASVSAEGRATLSTIFERDVTIEVRYTQP